MWARYAQSPPAIRRYGAAVLLVAVATLVRALAGLVVPDVLPFFAYFPAITIAAIYGGRGPGLLAIALSMVIGWSLFLRGDLVQEVFNVALFFASALLTISVAMALRRTVAENARLIRELHHYAGNDTQVILSGLEMLKAECSQGRGPMLIAEMEQRARRLGDLHLKLSSRVLAAAAGK